MPAKYTCFGKNNYARDLKFGSFDAARDDDCICLSLKMIYGNFVAYEVFFVLVENILQVQSNVNFIHNQTSNTEI